MITAKPLAPEKATTTPGETAAANFGETAAVNLGETASVSTAAPPVARQSIADKYFTTHGPLVESAPPSLKRRVVKWLFMTLLGVAAWYYYPRWRPLVTFGQAKPSGPAQKTGARVVPVRTAAV